jgi:hypothetical protein
MNERSCVLLVGVLILKIACIFLACGWIPSRVIQYPKYSSCCCANDNLQALTLSPASRSRLSTWSTSAKCSENMPLLITSRSLMYERMFSRPYMSSDIFSWKISGKLLIRSMCVPYISMYVSSLQSSKGHSNARSPHVRMIACALVTDVHTDAKSLARSPSKRIAVELQQVLIPTGSVRRHSHHMTTYVHAHARPTFTTM